MKKSNNFKVRLGLFVGIGLLLFTAGIYLIGKNRNLFGGSFRLRGVFKNISGLQVGNNVRFSGINVGTVDAIHIISDTTVMVELVMNESVQPFIKKDASVVIGSEGLMGNKIINILPGSSEKYPVENNDTLKTIKPLDIDDILKNVKVTADNAQIITQNLAFLTTNIREGKGMVGKLFTDTDFASDINQTVVNMKKGTQNINQITNAAQESFLLKPLFNKKKRRQEKADAKKVEAKKDEAEKADAKKADADKKETSDTSSQKK